MTRKLREELPKEITTQQEVDALLEYISKTPEDKAFESEVRMWEGLLYSVLQRINKRGSITKKQLMYWARQARSWGGAIKRAFRELVYRKDIILVDGKYRVRAGVMQLAEQAQKKRCEDSHMNLRIAFSLAKWKTL